MSSNYGENLKLSIFGQSHGAAIGMTLDGIPAGLKVDLDALQAFLSRRAPGNNITSTPRKEADVPEFLAGIVNGYTCGAPIAATIRNTNTRSADYEELTDIPRPGHADFTAQMKYSGYQDVAGGGHFSGRLTAALCIAGGLCKQWLEEMGIQIAAHIQSIGSVEDDSLDWCNPAINRISSVFPVVNENAGMKMRNAIADAKKNGNSLGGIVECFITGLPAGIGEPMFGGVENRIAQIVYGIPAVKGIEFGNGFATATLTGKENNDEYTIKDGKICTVTNNCGGILGGITNGMPVVFRVAVKPTASIPSTQQSVSLSKMEIADLIVKGRHDPCIVPRAVPVVEAAAAIAIYDMILGNTQKRG